MIELPEPIQRFIESSNRGDASAVISCFTTDSTLRDWGRVFEGRAGIADWDKTDNTGVRSHLEALNMRAENGHYSVTVRVNGEGFNGVGEMLFTLEGDRIARLDIE